jgi:hypothetical protein
MSRQDWAMLGVIGLSAFASGSLTCLAHQRIADIRHDPVPGSTAVEMGVELDSEGNFFFAPLKPSPGKSVPMGPSMGVAFSPMRLKTGHGAIRTLRWREETLSLFKGSIPFGLRPVESRAYLYVPESEFVPLAGFRLRHRR